MKNLSPNVSKALRYAKLKHEGQTYGYKPYISHIESVIEKCQEIGLNYDEILILACLHDVIEDANCSREELEIIFGKDIADNVWAISRQGEESYKEYIERIATYRGSDVFNVKLMDLLDNYTNTVLGGDDYNSLRARYGKAIRTMATFETHWEIK